MRNIVLFIFTLIMATITIGSDLRSATPAPEIADATAPEAVIPVREHLTITFVGDIMAHEMNYRHEPYDNIYADISGILDSSDLNFGNLEFVIDPGRPYSDFPVFNVKPVYVDAAISAGFNIFSLANNHTNDFGFKSALKTLESMKSLKQKHDIWYSGIFEKMSEQFVPVEIEREEWKIGFLSVAGFLNRPQKEAHINVVNYSNPEARSEFIELIASKADNYDLFILSFHGGKEYSLEPSAAKAEFFQDLVNAGVDIVWGHHPHVLQPWNLQTVDGLNKLILNSTGNFISGQIWFMNPVKPDKRRTYTGDSAIFRISLKATERGLDIVHVHPILISNYKHKEQGMVVRRFPGLTDGSLSKEWTTYYRDRFEAISRLAAVASTYSFLR